MNPYHYTKVDQPMLPPVMVPRIEREVRNILISNYTHSFNNFELVVHSGLVKTLFSMFIQLEKRRS